MTHSFFSYKNIIESTYYFSVHYKLILVSLFLSLLVNKSTSTEIMESKALSSAVASFSAKFCNELDKDKSVVSSPLSAEFVLALLTLGSTDYVHTELLTSLGIPDDDAIRSSFTEISSKLKATKGVTLNVANKVYVQDGDYELNPTLEGDAVKVFNAEIEKTDFGKPATVNIINKWVEDKTNNKIKDLLSPDSISQFTRLVLVNALYFKGTWTKQFEARLTMPRPFHVNEQKTINVPMMYQEENFRYGESADLNAQLLQMHYVGDEASMVIVLPNEINGLDEVLNKLAAGHDLLKELDQMYRTKVQVTIPKFKIETEIDLTQLLPKLGIKAIFDQKNTGLTKLLTPEEPLYVSTAVQKAFIEVNEEGAEAAAATGMVMMLRCARPPSPQFRADRAFLYVLTSADRVPAFIGIYRGDAETA